MMASFPYSRSPGILLAVALIRWRTGPAQTLLLLALVPQRLWYDQLLVFRVADTPRALLVLIAGSWLGYLLTPFFGPSAVVACIYLPALAFIVLPQGTTRTSIRHRLKPSRRT